MLYDRIYTIEVAIPHTETSHKKTELNAEGNATVPNNEVQADVYRLTQNHIDFNTRIVYNFGGDALTDDTMLLTVYGLGNNSGVRPIIKGSLIKIYAGYSTANGGIPSLLYEGIVDTIYNVASKHVGHVLKIHLTANSTNIRKARTSITFTEGTPFREALSHFESSLGKTIVATEAFKSTTFPEDITYFGKSYDCLTEFVKSYNHVATFVNDAYQVLPNAPATKGYSPFIVYDLDPYNVLDEISYTTEDANSTPTSEAEPEYLNVKLLLMPMTASTVIRLDPLKFGKDYGGDYSPETITYALDSKSDNWFTELKLRKYSEGELIFK